MRRWRLKRIKDQQGLSLLEVMVSLAVLLTIACASLPLLVFVTEASDANASRLVATKLASSVVEEIRALPYNQVGLIGGNPAGIVPHETTREISGRTYTIRTYIMWVDDPSDDVDGQDPLPYDYKQVRVVVTAPGLFSGTVTASAEVRTLVAQEGEEEAYPGGNVRARVWRGWQVNGERQPVANVRVDLTQGPDAPQTAWTGTSGAALFASLREGVYVLEPDPSLLGMITHPINMELEAEVTQGVTLEREFEVEYPCWLSLELRNSQTGALISSPGIIILHTPFSGNIEKQFTAEMNGVIDKSLFGGLWPVGEGYPGYSYGFSVMAKGYFPYVLADDEAPPWDGSFAFPGQHKKDIQVFLDPATASVTVNDANTGAPIVGATVNIYLHTYTYVCEEGESGTQCGWVDACSGAPVSTGHTRADGRADFNLPDNDLPPSGEPEDGDRYTVYCVKVTADGYLQSELIHNAFWVAGGQQMTAGGGVSSYSVNLVPHFRRILVRTERTNGNPRNQVRIRVEGPGGYLVEKRTGSEGSPGEALFSDLAAGLYTVYRRSGNSWIDPRVVDVQAGEYTVVYRY